MKDIICVKDQYYIRANSSLAEEQTHVLKHGDMFAVFNRDGNIRPLGFENHGLYFEGTRFLSRYLFDIAHQHPLLLSSTVKEDNTLMAVDFTNPDINGNENRFIPKGQLHLFRSCFLQNRVLYERIRLSNYGPTTVKVSIGFDFDADYLDIFEVRGISRRARGEKTRPIIRKNYVELGYTGLDRIERKTRIHFDPKPSFVDSGRAEFHLRIAPKRQVEFYVRVECRTDRTTFRVLSFADAFGILRREHNRLLRDQCHVETSNEQFNDWLNRASSDLFMMLTDTRDGLYPYAGIPWFNTVFGRDGIITALESLWIYPKIAKGVLQYLSKHQAKELLPDCDAEPGKILHEVRNGEMANLKEIPFGKYYGSIDSTLLYLILAGYYYQRSGDLELIQRIWPSLMSALRWIYDYGDRDNDGFVEYKKRAIGGLSQQGWKDSEDPIFHKDGKLARPPIALCEVQAYQYEAKIQMAKLARARGDDALSRKLQKEAERLKKIFYKAFWCEEIGMPAIALDGDKRPCRVMSSNAGQCLLSGILSRPTAVKVSRRLMSERFFNGWGIRTLASSEARFNPMSYHNGSVWPHDNALIASGFSRYGLKEAVIKIMTGLFNAGLFLELHRLPELFCGFERRKGEGPTLYPVACNPQTWASASVFLLLQSCLGMTINAVENKIYFNKPALPAYLEKVRIRNLKAGKARVDINFEYHPKDVGIKVVNRLGDIEVITVK